MRYIKTIIFFCLFVLSLSAQKEDYTWHFGHDRNSDIPGADVMQVDFNESSFHLGRVTTPYGFHHNSMAVCSSNGNLLFYTNGCAVMNKNHEVMPNGNTLNESNFKEQFNWDDCGLGYPSPQNLIILNDPQSFSGYYILHKTLLYRPNEENVIPSELRFTYIDLSLDSDLGNVTIADEPIIEDRCISGYLSAIKHKNERDWWIVQPLSSSTLIATFLLNDEGIIRLEDQESGLFFTDDFTAATGSSRFSPDGTKYALGNRFDNLHLYDFDRETGKLSTHQKIEVFPELLDAFSGQKGCIEWSPNSRFIYVTDLDSLHQIDTWVSDIEGNIEFIDEYDGTLNPFQTDFTMMALAPDCRIYVSSGSSVQSMHVIKHPNRKGKDCEFVQNQIRLPRTAGSMNIPLHTRWRVDEEEKCDPSLVTSITDLGWEQKDLKIFPNPAVDFINVDLSTFSEGTLYLYDLSGNLIFEKHILSTSEVYKLDIDAFSSGSYIIEYIPKDSNEKVFYQGVVQVVK